MQMHLLKPALRSLFRAIDRVAVRDTFEKLIFDRQKSVNKNVP